MLKGRSNLFQHETKRNVLKRYLIVLFIFLSYFVFVTFKYGLKNGILISLLTWSFFVFCTPIADAGFLLDFPVRIFTNIRMLHSEILVWLIAGSLNVYALTFQKEIYQKTFILQTFYHIITHPFPFWLIIIISAIGTFMSVYFADELIDVVKHEERVKFKKHMKKYRFILYLFLIIATIILYDYLIKQLGIHI